MTSFFGPQLIEPDGSINLEAFSNRIDEFLHAKSLAPLGKMLATIPVQNHATFEEAYKLFEPVFSLLEKIDTYARDPKLESIVSDWAAALGLSTQENFNRMLALPQPESQAVWLMFAGADPNAVLDPKSPESLTVIGHVCRVMQQERRDESTVREMVRVVLCRGEIPYSVKPRYDGDPDACDLFEATMIRRDGSQGASAQIFEAAEYAYNDHSLTVEAQEAIGKVCMGPGNITAYEEGHFHGNSAYLPLSFARFEDPLEWERTFRNVGAHARIDWLFYNSSTTLGKRMIENMVFDGARLDEIPVVITDDRIPCTLLQAAAWCGDQDGVKRLVEAGADPFKPVGAQSAGHKIADLDAIGLWEREPNNPPSEVMQILKARRAIVSALNQSKAAGISPA